MSPVSDLQQKSGCELVFTSLFFFGVSRLVFSQSLISLNLIEDFLQATHRANQASTSCGNPSDLDSSPARVETVVGVSAQMFVPRCPHRGPVDQKQGLLPSGRLHVFSAEEEMGGRVQQPHQRPVQMI